VVSRNRRIVRKIAPERFGIGHVDHTLGCEVSRIDVDDTGSPTRIFSGRNPSPAANFDHRILVQQDRAASVLTELEHLISRLAASVPLLDPGPKAFSAGWNLAARAARHRLLLLAGDGPRSLENAQNPEGTDTDGEFIWQ
jgi:hypothetical protein